VHTLFVDETMAYTGKELRSLWIHERFGLLGDAIVAFQGPCHVQLDKMVDQVDVRANAPIYSPHMLQFIAEHFDGVLETAIMRQRLLASILCDHVRRMGSAPQVWRRGDDLWDGERKLSVAIATVSPVSCLIHFGVNVRTEGVPVPAAGLEEYGIDPRSLAEAVLVAYADEMQTAWEARRKVRWVS
jgi:hypothetical protein